MRAWTYQDFRQKKAHGEKAPWSVGWIDPDGKRRSKRIGSQSAAEKYRKKIEGQLAAGTYEPPTSKAWKEFREEYDEKILDAMKPQTSRSARAALAQFERIAEPKRLRSINSQMIDAFIAMRKAESRGNRKKAKQQGSEAKLSPASVNKELRHLKAVLRVANDWGYLAKVPKFRMLREPKKLPRYVTPEHFAAIYTACETAQQPEGLPYAATDWWRGLLTFAYMTGWRIGEILALKREDLDLEAGVAITRAEDNKAGRDERTPLHEVVVEHLKKLAGFEPTMFPWYHHERTLWIEFRRIQQSAKIAKPYGFHDLRRAFATLNADRLTADALQGLMRHKSYLTTQKYINLARQLNQAVASLHVPDVLRHVR